MLFLILGVVFHSILGIAHYSLKSTHYEEIKRGISSKNGKVIEIIKVDKTESPFEHSAAENKIYKVLNEESYLN
jgi:hypothetical protein